MRLGRGDVFSKYLGLYTYGKISLEDAQAEVHSFVELCDQPRLNLPKQRGSWWHLLCEDAWKVAPEEVKNLFESRLMEMPKPQKFRDVRAKITRERMRETLREMLYGWEHHRVKTTMEIVTLNPLNEKLGMVCRLIYRGDCTAEEVGHYWQREEGASVQKSLKEWRKTAQAAESKDLEAIPNLHLKYMGLFRWKPSGPVQESPMRHLWQHRLDNLLRYDKVYQARKACEGGE